MNRPLPAGSLTPDQAADFVGPFLQPGEVHLSDGFAQAHDISSRQRQYSTGEGRLFITNARVMHWVEGEPEPWLYLDHADIVAVTSTTRDVPAWAIQAGLCTLKIVQAGRRPWLFYTNRHWAASLEQDFTSATPTPEPEPEPASHATPPMGQSALSYALVPPTDRNDLIPNYTVSVHALRVLDPNLLTRYESSVRAVDKALKVAVNSPPVAALLNSITDRVLAQYRERVQQSRLPVCDPEVLMSACAFGVALAHLQAAAGWTDTAVIHPAIHLNVAAVGYGLADEYGLGAQLVLEAAFLAAQNETPGDLFAD